MSDDDYEVVIPDDVCFDENTDFTWLGELFCELLKKHLGESE